MPGQVHRFDKVAQMIHFDDDVARTLPAMYLEVTDEDCRKQMCQAPVEEQMNAQELSMVRILASFNPPFLIQDTVGLRCESQSATESF